MVGLPHVKPKQNHLLVLLILQSKVVLAVLVRLQLLFHLLLLQVVKITLLKSLTQQMVMLLSMPMELSSIFLTLSMLVLIVFNYKAGTSEPATVSLTIEEVSDAEAGNQYIYYVDNASSGPATGSLADPFTEIASVEAASKAGDIIYILAGDAEYQGTVRYEEKSEVNGSRY